MGVVVAARHLQLGQRVAIKFVKGEVAADATIGARFLREARAGGALTSEHVCKVFDVGTLDNGASFMVMEHLTGIDLGAVLDRDGPLGIPDALSAVLQACEAITEAHSIGIVHRDLKPSNLFASSRADGTRLIKVLDFGISKVLETTANPSLTWSGSVMGSPGYMSPEQVRFPKTVDARTDVWALGVILYELLTGRAPFAAATLGETFARVLFEPVAPIRDRRPDVPEGLAAVIARCLERDVERRLQSVAAFASGLQPFAPPEAEISVARIRRIAAATPDRSYTATVAAPLDAGGPPFERLPTPGTRLSQPRVPTASVWQQSGGRGAAPQRFRRKRIFAAVGALALAGVGFGTVALRGRSDPHADSGRPSAASAVSAAPPPSVAVRETFALAPEPGAVAERPSASPLPEAGVPSSQHFARHPSFTHGHSGEGQSSATPPAALSTPTTTSNEKDIF